MSSAATIVGAHSARTSRQAGLSLRSVPTDAGHGSINHHIIFNAPDLPSPTGADFWRLIGGNCHVETN